MNMNIEEFNQREFIKRTVIVSAMMMVVLVFAIVIGVITWPNRTLNKIEKSIASAEYESAESLISDYEERVEDADLKEYKDMCSYSLAKIALENNKPEDARYRLGSIGDYLDSKELLKECDYQDAVKLLSEEKYSEANGIFVSISEYKDSDEKILVCRYSIAQTTYYDGDLGEALDLFLALGDYADAKDKADNLAMHVTGAASVEEAYKALEGMNAQEIQKIAQLTEAREALPKDIIAIGAHHTIGLKDDGTVLAAGLNDDGQCDVSEWSNIIAVDAGALHSVALTADGKVLVTGNNEYGQCDVAAWSDVTAIAAGEYNTYAVRSDGTVLSTGFTEVDTEQFVNIRKIGAGSFAAVFIDSQRTVRSTYQSLFINDLGAVDVDVSTGYIIALMPNGTVSATINAVDTWENIVAVSAGTNAVYAITADGVMQAHYFRERDRISAEYNDVAAVDAGGAHSAIVLSDGSAVAFGENDCGQCDLSNWDLIDEEE